jgi:hypothetical protein
MRKKNQNPYIRIFKQLLLVVLIACGAGVLKINSHPLTMKSTYTTAEIIQEYTLDIQNIGYTNNSIPIESYTFTYVELQNE